MRCKLDLRELRVPERACSRTAGPAWNRHLATTGPAGQCISRHRRSSEDNHLLHKSPVCIHIHKASHHFSAAHFTILSATRRERLHGHNYQVSANIESTVGESGLCFDYNKAKNAIQRLCTELDESVLLPTHSPHLKIERTDQQARIRFGEDEFVFPASDVTFLPISNITVEALAAWFLGRLKDIPEISRLPISAMTVTVSSGESEHASVTWSLP